MDLSDRDLRAFGRMIGVTDWGMDQDALRRVACMFRGLQLNYVHLEAEVIHGLTSPREAQGDLAAKVRVAYDRAKEWSRKTTRTSVSGGRFVDSLSPDHEVAERLTTYLARQLKLLGQEVREY